MSSSHSAAVTEAADQADLAAWVDEQQEQALDRLLRRYAPLVRGSCHRLLGHGQDADDATQAVLILFSEKAGCIRDSRCLAGWLHRCAVRVCGRLRRQQAARRRREYRAMPAYAEQATAPVDDEWEQLRPLLDHALDALPVAKRQVLIRCFLHEQDLATIADDLGISRDAARMRRNEGLDMLRRWFSRRGVVVVSLATVLDRQALAMDVPSSLTAAITGNGVAASPAALVLVKGMTMSVFFKAGVALVAVLMLSAVFLNSWAALSAAEPPDDASPQQLVDSLQWLASQQQADGSWPVPAGAPAGEQQRVTGLALLAFLGAGYDSFSPSQWQATVSKGKVWLSQQQTDGLDARCFAALVLGLGEDHALNNKGDKELLIRLRSELIKRMAPTERLSSREQLWLSLASTTVKASGLHSDRLQDAREQMEKALWSLPKADLDEDTINRASVDAVLAAMMLGKQKENDEIKKRLHAVTKQVTTDSESTWVGTLAAFLLGGEHWQEAGLPKHQSGIRQNLGRSMRAGSVVDTALSTMAMEVHYRYRARAVSTPKQQKATRVDGVMGNS